MKRSTNTHWIVAIASKADKPTVENMAMGLVGLIALSIEFSATGRRPATHYGAKIRASRRQVAGVVALQKGKVLDPLYRDWNEFGLSSSEICPLISRIYFDIKPLSFELMELIDALASAHGLIRIVPDHRLLSESETPLVEYPDAQLMELHQKLLGCISKDVSKQNNPTNFEEVPFTSEQLEILKIAVRSTSDFLPYAKKSKNAREIIRNATEIMKELELFFLQFWKTTSALVKPPLLVMLKKTRKLVEAFLVTLPDDDSDNS